MSEKTYEDNFKSLVKTAALIDGVKDEEGINAYVFAVNQQIKEWSFAELDDIYEEGIGENVTILTDELFAIAAGYALLHRYNLNEEEYHQWVDKQGKDKEYLLELIGIRIKRETNKEDLLKQAEDAAIQICYELKNSKRLIDFSDAETNYTLFGKPIKIAENAYKVVELMKQLENAEEFAFSILEKGLEERCSTHIECSNNIVAVLKDSVDAMWIRCKKYLRTVGTSKETIEFISKEYVAQTSEIYEIKGHLDDALMKLKDVATGKVNSIVEEDDYRRKTKIEGGGIGLGSMVAGMLTANITASVASAWADARLESSVEKLRKELEVKAHEIYLGKGTIEIYIELVEMAKQCLENICIEELFSSDTELQINAESFVGKICDAKEGFTGEQLREIASYTLFVFPCCIDVYRMIFDMFADVRDELSAIATVFNLDEEVNEWNDKLFGMDEGKIVSSDMVISRNGDVIEWNGLKYCGKKYIIKMPVAFPFFDSENTKIVGYPSLSHSCKMFNKEGEIIRVWGGYEGEEIYEKEINQSSSQILEQVNGFENINIKDFSQVVETEYDGDTFRQILRVELLCDYEKYDAYMLTYLDREVYFSICYGNKLGIEKIHNKYYNTLKKIEITKRDLQDKNDTSFLTEEEIFEIFRKDARERALDYYSAHRNEINISVLCDFRKVFKALVRESDYQQYIIEKNDYEIRNKNIIDILSKEEYKGQYVLYYSNNFLITDVCIFIWDDKDKIVRISYEEISEILPIESYLMGGAKRLCIRKPNYDYNVVYIKDEEVDEYVFISDLINIAIDFAGTQNLCRDYKRIHQNANQDLIFCQKCKKVASSRLEVGMLLNHFYCGNCNAERKYINRFIKDKYYKNLLCDIEQKLVNYQKQGVFEDEDIFLESCKLDGGCIEKHVKDDLGRKYVNDTEIKESMYCVFCGKQISRTAKFCNFCGKKVNYSEGGMLYEM